MSLSDIKWSAVTIAVLLLVIIGLGVTVKLQASDKALLSEQNATLQQEKTSAEAITTNVLKATALFNDIAQATHDDNQASNSDSERRVAIIRQAIKGDPCAGLPVPAASVEQLRANRNKVRPGATSSDTGKPAG